MKYENTFKAIDQILWKEQGCGSELDYLEQKSWMLFLKRTQRVCPAVSFQPDLQTLDKIARLLEVDAKELLTPTDLVKE